PRIPYYRNPRPTTPLARREIEHDVVMREFAIELPGRIQRVILPAVLVVHDDLRIPLREVEAPALSALAARQRRGPRPPLDGDFHRIAGRERPRQTPVRDGRIGGVWIVRHPEP